MVEEEKNSGYRAKAASKFGSPGIEIPPKVVQEFSETVRQRYFTFLFFSVVCPLSLQCCMCGVTQPKCGSFNYCIYNFTNVFLSYRLTTRSLQNSWTTSWRCWWSWVIYLSKKKGLFWFLLFLIVFLPLCEGVCSHDIFMICLWYIHGISIFVTVESVGIWSTTLISYPSDWILMSITLLKEAWARGVGQLAVGILDFWFGVKNLCALSLFVILCYA